MIFVTVGTHEQQFNRLIEAVDNLKKNEIIKEEVIVQTGFSTYTPVLCQSKSLFSYEEMIQNIKEARIIITHGGPSTFIMPLQIGKIPIVVPRQKRYGEHVNNHQVQFVEEVEKRQGNIIVVKDIEQLGNIITSYDKIVAERKNTASSNNQQFCAKLEEIVSSMFDNADI